MAKATFAKYDLKTRAVSEKHGVQYNPEKCETSKHNNVSRTARRAALSYAEFTGKKMTGLEIELLFDSYIHAALIQTDVREKEACYKHLRTTYQQVDSETHAPPVVQFSWGSMLFLGFVTSVTEKITMFSESGIPVRARVLVRFEGCAQEEQNEKPNNSPDRTRVYTVRQGETLWEIAGRMYGSTDKWRVIAEANGIENPRRLTAAAELMLPALPDD